MGDLYILVNKEPVQVEDVETWAMMFETSERIIAKTYIENVHISTVFLGLDHGFGRGRPILFETMIFGGELDGYQERYATYFDAEIGHLEAVQKVRETIKTKEDD